MTGQINLDSKLGKIIFNIVKDVDIKNIVEIGTWNGYGSTQCIKQSIIDNNKKDYLVYSLEINESMYNIAKINHDLPNFHLLLGRIISEMDLNWFNWNEYFNSNDGYYDGGFSKRKWLEEDIQNMRKVENVLQLIPENIDLLILDGGEFSTYPEYIKIGNRSKVIILDDTNVFKCRKIREELLESNDYEILYDELNDRNGFLVAYTKKIKLNVNLWKV
jgi:hypothetical protein